MWATPCSREMGVIWAEQRRAGSQQSEEGVLLSLYTFDLFYKHAYLEFIFY